MTIVDEYRKLTDQNKGVYNFVVENLYGSTALAEIVERERRRESSFNSVDSFLDRWIHQYKINDGIDPEKRGRRGDNPTGAKGFVLYHMNPVPGTPYFEIGRWKGLNEHTGHPESMIIAADTNGVINEDGMQLTVNDIEHERVLAYNSQSRIRPYNLTRMLPEWKEGTFIEGITAWELNQGEFPVTSPNPLKTYNYSWTMIGIQPLEVYDAMRRLGFVFPEPGERLASYAKNARRSTS